MDGKLTIDTTWCRSIKTLKYYWAATIDDWWIKIIRTISKIIRLDDWIILQCNLNELGSNGCWDSMKEEFDGWRMVSWATIKTRSTNREVTIGSRPVPTATSNDREEVRNWTLAVDHSGRSWPQFLNEGYLGQIDIMIYRNPQIFVR